MHMNREKNKITQRATSNFQCLNKIKRSALTENFHGLKQQQQKLLWQQQMNKTNTYKTTKTSIALDNY